MRITTMHNSLFFGIIRLALKVACMFAGGLAEEKCTCLNIHMWYSHLEI